MLKGMELMGMRVRDRISGFTGIVVSVAYDLYGCIQATVHPGMDDKQEKMKDQHWFDINRLEVLGPGDDPVMPIPDFEAVIEGGRPKRHEQGPAEKPPMHKV